MANASLQAATKVWKGRDSSDKVMSEKDDDKLARIAVAFVRLLPRRPRRECSYCCEKKLLKAFATSALVPYSCRTHVRGVCKSCLQASISAQLDTKPLLEIGCPSCSLAWDSDDIRVLLGHKDKKKFRQLDLLAKERTLVPSDLPDSMTLDQMLVKGTRFCPWCRWSFIKDGGCDYMTCSKCWKCFDISYALVLEDEAGRRAADVRDDEWDVDEW